VRMRLYISVPTNPLTHTRAHTHTHIIISHIIINNNNTNHISYNNEHQVAELHCVLEPNTSLRKFNWLRPQCSPLHQSFGIHYTRSFTRNYDENWFNFGIRRFKIHHIHTRDTQTHTYMHTSTQHTRTRRRTSNCL